MKRYSSIFFYAIVILTALWQLPWWYSFLTASTSKVPFMLWSSVAGDFISAGQERLDRSGRTYTREEVDSLLPFFYMRQLVADNRFPDSVGGRAVTPHEVQRTSFSFRSVPSDFNAPQAGLYPMLESRSGRVDLTMPDDVFRMTQSGIQFIVMADNAVNEAKSSRFTETMLKKGFIFPARTIAGNPTPKKDYDEGWLMLDDAGKLFHVKQTAGRPFVREVELPEGVNVVNMFVTEFRDRAMLGMLVDDRHRLHVLRAGSYEVVEAGLPSFDPLKESISIIGNMLDWTVCIKNMRADTYYALHADDFSLIDSARYDVDRRPVPGLRFTSADDKFVRPRLF